jgi:hypothetical protein
MQQVLLLVLPGQVRFDSLAPAVAHFTSHLGVVHQLADFPGEVQLFIGTSVQGGTLRRESMLG